MVAEHERCPECSSSIVRGTFDATFRLDDASERLCFDIPAGLCRPCGQLFIQPELIDALDLWRGHCVFAIQSDRAYARPTL